MMGLAKSWATVGTVLARIEFAMTNPSPAAEPD